jgi:CRP/FNR family transcriptional regulator, cyclic AMP receptor protein
MLSHLQPLIKPTNTRKFSKGSTVLYQGEVPRYAHILVSGVLRVFSISAQGDEQIVTYHVPGDFFPTSWLFSKATSTLFFYEAVTECKIAFVAKNELVDFMLADPERTRAMLDYFTTNYSACLIRINALEQPKARDKLIYTLYYLCERYGERKGSHVRIGLTLTHQNLASMVGVTRETAATEMNRLKKQNILSYENQKYTVDTERLLNLIGEDSFRELDITL